MESNPFRLSQKGRRFRGPDFPAYRNTPCYRQAPIKSAGWRICSCETDSLASAKAAVGSTRAMLGRLSEPDKDSDPAIDGLQRPLRKTFRDFRFLRVHGTDAITASHGIHDIHGMHGMHGMQSGHGIHGCHGIDGMRGSEGVYAGYGMGGIDAMDGRNNTSGINGISGMYGIIGISAVSGTDGRTAKEGNDILLTDHSYETETCFYLRLQSERRNRQIDLYGTARRHLALHGRIPRIGSRLRLSSEKHFRPAQKGTGPARPEPPLQIITYSSVRSDTQRNLAGDRLYSGKGPYGRGQAARYAEGTGRFRTVRPSGYGRHPGRPADALRHRPDIRADEGGPLCDGKHARVRQIGR